MTLSQHAKYYKYQIWIEQGMIANNQKKEQILQLQLQKKELIQELNHLDKAISPEKASKEIIDFIKNTAEPLVEDKEIEISKSFTYSTTDSGLRSFDFGKKPKDVIITNPLVVILAISRYKKNGQFADISLVRDDFKILTRTWYE